MQRCIFSIITSVFSVTSEIIDLMLRKHFLLFIINVVYYFLEAVGFCQDSLMNKEFRTTAFILNHVKITFLLYVPLFMHYYCIIEW